MAEERRQGWSTVGESTHIFGVLSATKPARLRQCFLAVAHWRPGEDTLITAFTSLEPS